MSEEARKAAVESLKRRMRKPEDSPYRAHYSEGYNQGILHGIGVINAMPAEHTADLREKAAALVAKYDGALANEEGVYTYEFAAELTALKTALEANNG